MMGMGPEQAWKSFESIGEIREKFIWAGRSKYPDRTEEEAWKDLESYIHPGDNAFVTQSELEEMGFARKDSETEA